MKKYFLILIFKTCVYVLQWGSPIYFILLFRIYGLVSDKIKVAVVNR